MDVVFLQTEVSTLYQQQDYHLLHYHTRFIVVIWS